MSVEYGKNVGNVLKDLSENLKRDTLLIEEKRKLDIERAKDIEKLNNITQIEIEFKNRLGKPAKVQESIVTKYIETLTPILKNIINTSTNTEKNEKKYAQEKLKLLESLSQNMGGFTSRTLGDEITELDILYNSFDPNTLDNELENLKTLKEQLQSQFVKVESESNNLLERIFTNPINKLKDIQKQLNSMKNIDYHEQEKQLQLIDFNEYNKIKNKLIEDLKKNFHLMSSSEFSDIMKKIQDKGNQIIFSLNPDILKSFELINNEIKDLSNKNINIESLVKQKQSSYNTIFIGITNDIDNLKGLIINNISKQKQNIKINENKIIVERNTNIANTKKHTIIFKILLASIVILSILLIISIVLIKNIGASIGISIFTILLTGGLVWYYRKYNGYIQKPEFLKKSNKITPL